MDTNISYLGDQDLHELHQEITIRRLVDELCKLEAELITTKENCHKEVATWKEKYRITKIDLERVTEEKSTVVQ